MSVPWIKIRKNLRGDRRVMAMARRLNVRVNEIVGALEAFWSWADDQTADGHLPFVAAADIDRVSELSGFAAELVSVGWLVLSSDGATIPEYEAHNSNSAKRRALEQKRQDALRAKETRTQKPARKRDRMRTRVTTESEKELCKDLCSEARAHQNSCAVQPTETLEELSEVSDADAVGTATATATATAAVTTKRTGAAALELDARDVRVFARALEGYKTTMEEFRGMPIVMRVPIMLHVGGVTEDVSFRNFLSKKAQKCPELAVDILRVTLEALRVTVKNPGGFYRSRLRALGWADI